MNLSNAEQLKTQTATYHQQLEKVIIAKIKAMQTIEEYVSLIKHFYAFFGGLEEKIKIDLVRSILPDYESRRKTAHLEQDLVNCGSALSAKASGVDLPEIMNVNQAMGALYVIEGSSLGGQIISQMIRRQLNLPDNDKLAYFTGYGDNTGSKWQTFREAIDHLPDSSTGDLIATANQTFLMFGQWIAKH